MQLYYTVVSAAVKDNVDCIEPDWACKELALVMLE